MASCTGRIADRRRSGEPRLDRIHAAGVDAGFVHAGTVVVADDLSELP